MAPPIPAFGWHDKDPSTPLSAAKLEEFGTHIGNYAEARSKAGVSDRVLFVSQAGDDATGDGRSWASAYKTIQKAVDNAASGSQIILGNGLSAQETKIKTSPDALRITGQGLWPGDNSGTTIAPATDTGLVFHLEDVDFTRIEHINFRNTSRAKFRGVLIFGRNCNSTRVVNCGLSNNTSVANPETAGTLGGTGAVFCQGENNRLIECDFNGLHLPYHLGRENAQTHVLGGSTVNCYRTHVLDNFIYSIDEFADYSLFGFVGTGSSSVLGASAGELASLKAEPAQTVRGGLMFVSRTEQAVSQAKVKIGKGDGLALTHANTSITTNPAETTTPVNGGKIKLKSVTGIPTKGLIFSLDREIYSYDGVDVVNKEVENIQRKQMGSSSSQSAGLLGSTQTLYIPTGDALLYRYNQKAQQLQICKLVAGVVTVLTSVALALAEGTSIYLYAESEDNYLRCQAFAGTGDDPVNIGDPHWAYGTPLATVEFTLTGEDATRFGTGVFGLDGHRLDTENTAWRMDNYRLWAYSGAPAGGGHIKRHKATVGGPCRRRDGTALSTSTVTPIRPTHRCEYHGWMHSKSNRVIAEAVDWDESTTGQYYYIGSGQSFFKNCLISGVIEFDGKFVVVEGGTYGNAEITGHGIGFVNGAEASTWKDLNPSGYNYYDRADWAVNANVPETGLMKTGVEPGPNTETIPRTERLPFFTRRAERWHGHHFHEGALAEAVPIKFNAAVGNGFMIAIPVFGRATWPKFTFKVLAGGKGNLRVGVYALDPHSLLPMVHADFPTHPARLLDAGQAVATEEKQQVITAVAPLVTTVDWLGILLYARTGTEATVAGLTAQPGSPAPFGFDEAIDAAPPIFARYSIPEGTSPTFPAFHSLSTSGPNVRAYRSV